METTVNEQLFVKFENGKIFAEVYLENYTDDELNEAMTAWALYDDDVEITLRASLAEMLENEIVLHEMPIYEGRISNEAREIFSALREELAGMVARIDALEYGRDGEG